MRRLSGTNLGLGSRLAVACLACLAGVAQSADPMRLPAFGEVVDVRVINVEVVVTRRGERVGGLAADAFRLRVDGEEVPIEFFTEVAGGRTIGALPALPPGEAVGTRYLVFIDDDFAIASHRNRVLRELSSQLELLAPEDRMAVAAFGGRRVDLLSPWTRSIAALRAAFEEAQLRAAYGLLRRSERRRGLQVGGYGRLYPGGLGFAGSGFRGDPRGLASEQRYPRLGDNVSRVVRAATTTLRGFAAAPGRKVMLLLAGGWPAYDGDWGGVAGPDDREIAQRLFAPLVDTANRLGYTLYPVDLEGTGSSGVGAGYRTLAGALGAENERRSEVSLIYLAEATGGRAMLGGARLTALERTALDTRSYYWLGFTPDWQQDDREHQLSVETTAARTKVRTRTSFSDLSRQTEVTMWVESAHLFDSPLPEGPELGVTLGDVEPGGARKVILPLRLEVPLDQVTLVPVAGGYAASLELRVAATDAAGGDAGIPVLPMEIRITAPAVPGQVGVYETRLKLRCRPHRLLITVFDPPTGKVLAKRLKLEP